VTFEGARFCEGRVWTFFGNVTSEAWAEEYLDYASGHNLTNRMPLWVQPAAKISLAEVEHHMRNTFQHTPLDMSIDVGAGGGASAQRNHPLTWSAPSFPGATYLNERPIGTQQTGWNFVASLRPWMPDGLKGVLWFGVDDSSTTARFPVYGSSTATPAGWGGAGAQDGVVPPMMTFNMKQAFTVFNLVANLAYTRWSEAFPIVEQQAKDSTASFLDVRTRAHRPRKRAPSLCASAT
jgi:dipeptidase